MGENPKLRVEFLTSCSGVRRAIVASGSRPPPEHRGRELGRFVVALPHDSIGTTIPQNDRLLAIVLVDQLGALLAAERDPRGNDGT